MGVIVSSWLEPEGSRWVGHKALYWTNQTSGQNHRYVCTWVISNLLPTYYFSVPEIKTARHHKRPYSKYVVFRTMLPFDI